VKKKTRSFLLWLAAVVSTLIIFTYQRITGPTQPVMAREVFNGKEVSYRLLRSQTVDENIPVRMKAVDKTVTGYINYRRYKTDDPWQEVEMTRQGDFLVGEIPAESRPATKVEYTSRIVTDNQSFLIHHSKSIVARFRGSVPPFFLITHIIFMILGFVFALRTGMEALRKEANLNRLLLITLIVVFIGGLILGPIVQKYAFGDFWTGVPFGIDLTDNKTLIAFISLLLAFFLKKKSRWWVVAAAVVMIIVYLIPHSVLGSELDYKTGTMRNKYSINRLAPIENRFSTYY
jgi:hypothetical protein